jgi:hypothetical protein
MDLMNIVKSLLGFMRLEKKAPEWNAVVIAVAGGSAYLAQGASYSYLRARTLLAGPRLFQDADFGYALQICKWEGFAVAGQDILLMIESELRPQLPADNQRRKRVLMQLYRAVLDSEPIPEHRQETGWDDVVNRFDQRLDAFMAGRPLKPDAISTETALCLLKYAPVDDEVRRADKMMVVNNVGFRFIDFQSKLREQFDFKELAQMLNKRMTSSA